MKRIILALLLASTRAYATGQCDQAPVESYAGHPDDHAAYAGGKLGLVPPTFPRMYLALAYFYGTGGSLDEATRADVVHLFERRHFVGRRWVGLDAWTAVRAKLGKPPKPVDTWSDGYDTCLDDAFATAAQTVARLEKTFSHDELLAWRDAQDQVFANCGSKTPSIPSSLPKTASAAARAERNYQIAAATMYASRDADAAVLFTKIGKDTGSPWASWGDYLAARALIRDSAIASAPEDPTGTRYTEAGLVQARAILERLVGPHGIPERAKAARALLSFVRARQSPTAHIAAVAGTLKKGGDEYGNALADFVVALDHALGEVNATDVPFDYSAPALEALRQKSDLVDWVVTYSSMHRGEDETDPSEDGQTAFPHALERWKKTRALPWLVAALAGVPIHDAAVPRLLAAAAAAPRDAPLHDTILYYELSLSVRRHGDRAPLIERLAREITERAREPRSSLRNRLLDLRLGSASSFDDALDYSMRHSVGVSDDCGLPDDVYTAPRADWAHPEVAPALEQAIESGMSLPRLVTLAADPHTPELLRARVRRMSWTRALVRGDAELESKLRAELDAPSLQALRDAKTPEERRLQAALVLVDAKGKLDFGALDGRLTCPGVDARDDGMPRPLFDKVFALVGREDIAARTKELAAMRRGGSTFDVGVAWLIAWANEHPDDPRLPKIFYDLNDASRRLHGACQASRSSKTAYLTMHKLWPQHTLTKKVKYWY
jgi:hypothetical protein